MNHNQIQKYFSTAAVLLWLLLIWGQSALPAAISSGESIAILNMLPAFMRGVTEYMIRKSAHFVEYLILGILLKNSFSRWEFSSGSLLMSGMTAALTDETIQLFVEGRSSQVSDVWLDFAGFCTGVFLYACINALIGKISARKR